MVVQQKTHRPVQFELTADLRATLLSYLERRSGSITDHLFPSRIDYPKHMNARQGLVWFTGGSLRLVCGAVRMAHTRCV